MSWGCTYAFSCKLDLKKIFSTLGGAGAPTAPPGYAYGLMLSGDSIIVQGDPQKLAPFLYAFTLPNINSFSKLFHSQNQEKICSNVIIKDPTHLKCVATLPCEMSSVLKATIENKDDVRS